MRPRRGRGGPSPRVRGELPSPSHGEYVPPGHPRVCGENAADLQPQRRPDRAIPACAGRTLMPSGAPLAIAGHPRVCGENAGARLRCLLGLRAIPACAGRTPVSKTPRHCVFGPSPRVRGERSGARCRSPCPTGHPRVCGENAAEVVCGWRGMRAIPACAGRTLSQYWGFARQQGPKSPAASAMLLPGALPVKRSMACRHAASRTAIIGRPSRSTRLASTSPWTRSP